MAKTSDKKITEVLNMLLEDARAHRKERAQEWEKHLKKLDGEMEVKHRGKNKATTKTNFLFAQMETIKPILTSNVPTISLKPVIENEAWTDIANLYSKSINRILMRNDIRQRLVELITNGLNIGKGYFKSTWNVEMFAGNGDVKIEVPDSRMMFLEPNKMEARDWNYVFETTSVDELTLMRRFPEKADEIHSLFQKGVKQQPVTPSGSVKQIDTGISSTAPGEAASTATRPFFEVAGVKGEERLREIELAEAWFYDDEMVEQEIEILTSSGSKELSPKTGKPKKQKVMKKRYPFGRVIIFSGDVIFSDKPNKFPGFPYVDYRNYFKQGDQYNVTELKHMVPIQDQFDIRNNQLFDLLSFNLAPIHFFDPRSGLDPDLVTNAPNQWIPVNDVNAIKTDPAPRIGVAAFESREILKRDLETIPGVREVTQGTIPGDIRSGVAIEALQEAADVRLRGKSGELEMTMKNLARFLISMITKFYIHKVHYRVDEELFNSEEFEFVRKKTMTPEFFDIEIRAGVNLPRSRVAKQQLLLELHARSIIDDRYLIENIQLDGKEALIARMERVWDARLDALQTQAEQVQMQGGEQVGNTI